VAAGMDPARFWEVTPCEFQAALRGSEERSWRALRQAQSVAWSQALVLITGWHNPRARQKFTTMFPDPRAAARRKSQTDGDMLAALRLWVAAPKR